LRAGDRLVDALNLDREVLDISVTPNRADCLSVIGLAREVAVAFRLPMTIPDRPLVLSHVDAVHPTIEIADPLLCPCYLGRVITGVTIAPSPLAIRYRLHAVGVRAISNVVDVTNYILMECGQPLHSFDLGQIRGGRIIVDRAGDGERFTTLDGQERVLDSRDLTIRDAGGATALAGVMGGLSSEITSESAGVFLESAIFHPATIRGTARRQGLHSEASFRFERGVDQLNCQWSLDRACAMMQTLAGGIVSDRLCASEPAPFKAERIVYRPARCTYLIGEEPGAEFSKEVLTGLGCQVEDKGETWEVLQPSWRPDLTRECDLIEEVARYYGMDRVKPVLPPIERSLDDVTAPETTYSFYDRLRRWGSGLGLNEAINYSFVGSRELDLLNLPAEGRIMVMNPLSADQDVLRTVLAPGLLHTLSVNMRQNAPAARIFEIASVFHQDDASYTTARETGMLGIMLSGRRFDSAWPQKGGELDYLDLKGITENLLRFLKLPAMEVRVLDSHPYLVPAVEVSAGKTVIGCMGRVKPAIADKYEGRWPVWMAEYNLETLRELCDATKFAFQDLPTYPAVRRDITVLADPAMKAQTILDAIWKYASPLLEDAVMVDLFVPADKATRNLTFRLTFRHAQKTLKDADADKERDRLVGMLEKNLGVRV
ncbi:MAG: phenylalanine--tRNA ligase subunit beta, partial [Desulfovibrionaceae bacterium]|nr:phenylalanine--tRNA ligase subunit beta [Desulfovibrionaceae bacterium]